MPGGAGIEQRRAAENRCAIHQPDRRRAVGALPEKVRLAVAVEIAGADDVPSRAWIESQYSAPGEVQPVHVPDDRRAVGVLPKDVGLAVTIEVARTFDL